MNYLAAMLLLALDQSEEKAFWVLVSLIDDDEDGALAILLSLCMCSASHRRLQPVANGMRMQ
jgi:hypothetical protein